MDKIANYSFLTIQQIFENFDKKKYKTTIKKTYCIFTDTLNM